MASASGDGREEGDLARSAQRRRRLHVHLVERGAHDLRARERLAVLRAALLQPADEIGDGLRYSRAARRPRTRRPTFSRTHAK